MLTNVRRRCSACATAIVLAACAEASAPTDEPREATILAAASPTSITATVGSTVVDLPSVIAQDADGDPTPGVVVTFRVLDGYGRIAGATVTTNSAGIARLGEWTLGVLPGANVVTAASGSLAVVAFRATGVAGPPDRLQKIAGDNQVAAPGMAVLVPPRVRVTDRFGNPLTGIVVMFTIENGGGAVSGGTVPTDTTGTATLTSWTLGPRGSHSIAARVGTLPPVFFNAAALDPILPCASPGSLSDRYLLNSELTLSSCQSGDGRWFDSFFAVASYATGYAFTLSSGDFDTYLELWAASGEPIASNDDGGGTGTNSAIKAILPPGTLRLVATSARASGLGKYSLSYSSTDTEATGCGPTFIVRGTVSFQEVNSRDCLVATGQYEDRFRIWLRATDPLIIELQDQSYSDQKFYVTDSTDRVVGESRSLGGYEYGLLFEPPTDGYYSIKVLNPPGEFIAYKLAVK